MIQNFGGGEIIVIILVALVVLGPDRLPEMARSAGKMLHKFRTMTSGLQDQVKDVMDDPAMQPLRELGEFAARPRQKLSEYAFEAEAEERAKAERASLEAAATAAPSPEPAALPDPAPDAGPTATVDTPAATPLPAQEDATDPVAPPERESA